MKRSCAVLLLAACAVSASAASTFIRETGGLPDWAVPYGGEFWRRPASSVELNLGDVVERVSLAIAPDGQGTPVVQAPGYDVRFTESGFVFLARAPRARLQAPAETLFRTLAVRQGPATVCRPGALEWVVLGNTAQARLDPVLPIVQHCEAARDGVQVTWVLGREPSAAGDVIIEVEAGGLAYVAATSDGHHFADAEGHARVRVGRAEAVDSEGRRWDLAVHPVDGRLEIIVPGALLAEARYPLAVDPAVSPEFGLNNLLVAAPADEDQWYVQTVWGGTNFLVVWQDNRAGDWSDYEQNIFGARVSAEGQLVDPYGLAICVQPGPQTEPGLGWNGTDYYVAWEDARNWTNYLIYGTRVGLDGSVLDSGGVRIGALTNRNQSAPSVATRTGSVLVVWEDVRSGKADIYGRLVDAGGQPAGASDFAICTVTNAQEKPVAAWGETNFLVAWEDYRHDNDAWDYSDVYGARVGSNGVVLDPAGLAIGLLGSSYQKVPTAAWGGSNFLVAWEDSRNVASSNRYDVYAARVTSGGQVLDPSAFAVSSFASNQYGPSVTWGGTNFLAVWSDYRRGNTSDLFAARISPVGLVLDPGGISLGILAEDQSLPSVAWNGSRFLVAWQSYTHADDYYTHIFAQRITETGGVLDAAGFRVSQSGNSQEEIDAAWGQTNWLVVWRDNLDETTSDLYGARVAPAGTVLDPAGIAICTATNKQRDPAVAWGGTNFLVVWSDDRNLALDPNQYADIYGARVSSAGQVVDAAGFLLCTNLGPQNVPDIAYSTAGVFLVVWEDYLTAGPPYYGDIGGTRVNGSGTVLDPGYTLIPVSTSSNHQYGPEVAAGPTNFLVVWHDRRNARNYSIYAARIDSARNILDSTGFPVGVGSTNCLDPDVAWGATNFLVVWEDYRESLQGSSDIYGGRVSPGGAVLDGPGGFSITTETNTQSDPVVGWSGTNFLAAWVNENLDPNSLWASRVDSGGRVLDSKDPGGFELFTNRVRRVDPSLAPRSNGLFLVAHSRFRTDGFNTFRVFSALLDLAPPALRVVSPHGTGEPAVGTNYFVRGTPVYSSILDSPVTGGDTQWVCRAWTGAGDAPSGTGTNTGLFTLDNDSTVTWLWTTNYRLAVAVSGRGSADWTNGWVPYASNATVTASQGAHFYFAGWSGDVPGASTNNNPVVLAMTGPRLAVVNFAPYLATNRVPHWWLAEHDLATNDAAALADGDGDFLKTWEEFVAWTDPTNAASYFAAVAGMGAGTTLTMTLSGSLTDRVYDVLSGSGSGGPAGPWAPLGLQVPGTGSNLTFTITNAAPNSFHRFSVTLP